MTNSCKHTIKPFSNLYGEPAKPTEHQIRKYKLYQCKECKKWFSFLEARGGE